MDYSKQAIRKHKQLRGKIGIVLKVALDDREKLSTFYTPGVGAVSSYVAKHPDEVRDYTWINNNLAIVSDGSAVLGLGNIGPYGALPVMEGKAMLFKQLAGIDAVPIVLDVHSADEIVAAIQAIAPSFGAINLEDIAAPICFEVEERLKSSLTIPVMHDDQHGTAIVVLAGLINACKVTGRDLKNSKVVVVGAGAAGIAIARLIYRYAEPALIAVDSRGIISGDRKDLNPAKQQLLALIGNPSAGTLADALRDADIMVGVSGPSLVTGAMVRTMAKDPIIFAMANPMPEIMPAEALKAGAAVVATGRSDFPNQINNALAFPGIFRGALDNRVNAITYECQLAVAAAIAGLVKRPTADNIIPKVLDAELVKTIAPLIV